MPIDENNVRIVLDLLEGMKKSRCLTEGKEARNVGKGYPFLMNHRFNRLQARKREDHDGGENVSRLEIEGCVCSCHQRRAGQASVGDDFRTKLFLNPACFLWRHIP